MFTVTAEAPPVMVCVVVSTCLRSTKIVELAAIAAVVNNDVPARPRVNVAAVAAVLVTAILVTVEVVDAGTVYRTVVVVVVAAPRNSGFTVVAISYYLPFG
jgi:hypothetical protein